MLFSYTPGRCSFSITGSACSLQCAHCMGRYLRGMHDASTPEKAAEALASYTGQSILVSGGAMRDGRIPYADKRDVLQVFHRDGRKLHCHTGFMNQEDADVLRRHGASSLMMDVVGSEETMREVYRLEHRRMEEALEAAASAGIPLYPHILIGVHHGRILGEYSAVDTLSSYDISGLVFLVLIPPPWYTAGPPDVDSAVRVMRYALEKLDVPASLGCMRPGGTYRDRLDAEAIRLGITRVVHPSPRAVAETGAEVSSVRGCCIEYR